MNANQTLGYMRVIDALQGGEDIGSVMCEMANARLLSQASADVFSGALGCMMDTFQKIKKAGLPVSTRAVKDPTLNRFMAHSYIGMSVDFLRLLDQPCDEGTARELGNRLWCVCQAVNRHRKALSWRYDTPAKAAKPEPQEIRIVAMPDRKTETAVHRNAEDEIVSTIQVQSDIKWPETS